MIAAAARVTADMPHILLATLGTTPQVLTEAFYYYRRHLGITFDQVHVLTTVPGAAELRRTVLGPRGAFARLCRHLDVPRRGVRFGPQTIHILRGADGEPVDDVRSTDDGRAVARQMLEVVRDVCADPGATVHALVSGGRKVTSVYLHAMMQIAGRPQDRLFHILVHPVIEEEIVDRRRRLDYFYPPGTVRVGRQSIPEQEQLVHIEVPLLCISPRDALERDLPWDELIERRRREAAYLTAPPSLMIEPSSRSVHVGDVGVTLPARRFFWYYAVARLKVDGYGPLPAAALSRLFTFAARGRRVDPSADSAEATRLEGLLETLRSYHLKLFPHDADRFDSVVMSALEPDPRRLREHFAKVNAALRSVLDAAAEPYEARVRSRDGAYEINVSADAIECGDGVSRDAPQGR